MQLQLQRTIKANTQTKPQISSAAHGLHNELCPPLKPKGGKKGEKIGLGTKCCLDDEDMHHRLCLVE